VTSPRSLNWQPISTGRMGTSTSPVRCADNLQASMSTPIHIESTEMVRVGVSAC
jgi:hypothetical protein